ncbi:hypothetical protein [Staphylococcus phage ZCSS1]|uniref:Uncharacterized protein n=1 Tax=Staphylococcus phage UHP46 TaxID=3234966 RepID=A0AB39C8B3_9CAUD|nr:hypothetical protein [Staphylococcus phage ZCSS1]
MDRKLFKDLLDYIEHNGYEDKGRFPSHNYKSIDVTLLTYDFKLQISYVFDKLGDMLVLSGIEVIDVDKGEWIGCLLDCEFRTLTDWHDYKDMKLRDIINVMLIDHKKSWGISEEEPKEVRVKDFLYGE